MAVRVIERYTPSGSEQFIESEDLVGKFVWEAIPEQVQESNLTVQVILNGVELDDDGIRSVRMQDGDFLSLRAVPRDPVSALIVAALPYIVTAIVSAAIGIALNYLITAIIGPPKKPKKEKKESATYSFDTPRNTTDEGTPIGIGYGRLRVAGHILQARTVINAEGLSEIFMLVSLGEGGEQGIQSICGITQDVDDLTGTAVPDTLEINDTPASSYKGIRFSVRMGTKHQRIIPGFEDQVINTTPFDITLSQGVPFTYTTQNPVDGIEFKLKFPGGLFATGDSTSFRNYTVKYFVKYWPEDTPLAAVQLPTKSVTRSTRSEFILADRIDNLVRSKYVIQVTRLTVDDDPEKGKTSSEMLFQEVLEILNAEVAHVGKALYAVKAIATDQLNGTQPNLTVLAEMIKVRVYSTPTTYAVQWSNNPAWCILDLLTSKTYGLGNEVRVDEDMIQTFIELAAHANENASDGVSPNENRYELDVYLDEVKDGLDWVYLLCQTCLSSIFKFGSSYRIKPARLSTSVMTFSPGNSYDVRGGYTAVNERVNYLQIAFWDKEQNYRQASVVVLDDSVQGTEHYIKETDEFIGVVRKSQVLRLGTFRINSHKLCTRYAKWKTSVPALRCTPGDVVDLSCDEFLWGLAGGRIQEGSTNNFIKTDRLILFEPTKVYYARIWHKDGSTEERQINNPGKEASEFTLFGILLDDPLPEEIWSVGEANLVTKQLTIVDITRTSDLDFELFGVEYNPLAFSDEIVDLPPPSGSSGFDARRIPQDITNLVVTERVAVLQDGALAHFIDVSFTPPPDPTIAYFDVWMKLREHDDWGDTPKAPFVKGGYVALSGNFEIGDVYDVTVTPRSSFGVRKSPDLTPRVGITIFGDTAQPGDVTGFKVVRFGDALVFTWDPVPGAQIKGYEIRAGTIWESATVIVSDHPSITYETGVFFTDLSGTLSQTFLIKARNTSGNYSQNASQASIFIDPKINTNVVLSRNEKTLDWPGTLTNLIKDPVGSVGNRFLELVPPASAPYTGTYLSPTIDLNFIYRSQVSLFIEALQIDTTMNWGAATFSWGSDEANNRTWQGPLADQNNLVLLVEYRTGNSLPLTGGFSPFTPFEGTFQFMELKVSLTTADKKFTARINQMRLVFDVDDILDSGRTAITGTGTVTYNKQYTNEATIALEVTVQDMASGDFYLIDNRTKTGFRITFFDSLGVQLGLSRTFDWFTRGI